MPTLTVTKTYLDNSTLSETDLDNIKNSIETFFNITKADSTNINCDSIGSGMTSTGANAIAALMTSSALTTILAKIATTEGYRVQGNSSSKLAFQAPLTATGSTISSFTGSATSASDITNATVTLTVRNRPILLQLQSTSTGTTATDGTITCGSAASIFLVKAGTIIQKNYITCVNAGDVRPVSSIQFVDLTPGTGSKTYKLQYAVDSGSLTLKTCRLVAVEL